MGKFGDIQYLIDRPEPSEIFLKARHIAGVRLQEQFQIINQGRKVESSFEGFKWIKADVTYPSFDNLTFAYKSSVFSVVVELIYNNRSSFEIKQRERLIKASEAFNLVPCIFKVLIQNSNYPNDYDLVPKEKGWNLIDLRNNHQLNPVEIAVLTTTKMSIWELSNFAIQVVRDDLVKQGMQILSYCDLPDINPQVWFKDKYGNMNWIIVKHVTNVNDLDYREWIGLEKSNHQLLPFDGYYAAVQFYSLKTNSTEELNRGDPMTVNYRGIERIYLAG